MLYLSKNGSMFGFSHTACKYALYTTDTKSVASVLADFYALSTSASLEYVEKAGVCVTLLRNAYSSYADVNNA
jgi:hypothetical protein